MVGRPSAIHFSRGPSIIEIAEAIGSTYLLSHAVEALVEYAGRRGFCDAGALGERLVSMCETMPDRVEAHEGLVTAAISFARAGRLERARAAAREATRQSVRLSAHHATHAAAGEVMALVPAGRFAELAGVTERVIGVVREEGGRVCQMGSLGLAGRALALRELGERRAAAEALELFESAPLPRGLVPFRCLAIELLRPLIGVQRARVAAESCGACRATVSGNLHDLRLELQLVALSGDTSSLGGLVARARELAAEACAPTLEWVADWAEAVVLGGEAAVARANRRGTGAGGPRRAVHRGAAAGKPPAVPRARPPAAARRGRGRAARPDGGADERGRGPPPLPLEQRPQPQRVADGEPLPVVVEVGE